MTKITTLTTCLFLAGLSVSLAAEDKADGWLSLFDGRTLMGWESSVDHPESFSIEDGAIKVNGRVAHLFYVGHQNHGQFRDFEFKAKVKTRKNSNSGIYFHTQWQDVSWPKTGYECQVNNSHSDWRRTGGLYGVQDVRNPPSKDDEWFDYYIKVQGKQVIIKINGQQVVDYTEGEQPEHLKETPGRKIGEGTFCLQAHDPGSTVYFKEIYARPL
jgi:hypothetical protein